MFIGYVVLKKYQSHEFIMIHNKFTHYGGVPISPTHIALLIIYDKIYYDV